MSIAVLRLNRLSEGLGLRLVFLNPPLVCANMAPPRGAVQKVACYSLEHKAIKVEAANRGGQLLSGWGVGLSVLKIIFLYLTSERKSTFSIRKERIMEIYGILGSIA